MKKGSEEGKKTTGAAARNGFGRALRGAFLAAFVCAWGGGDAALAQTVTDVRARQRWPWNNLVDIDYTIEGATNAQGQADASGLYIRFRIEDGDVFLDCRAAALDPPSPPVTNGAHRVTWDPAADGVRLRSTNVVCRAALRRDAPDRYLAVDLSGGKDAAKYPVAYFSAMPPGGWTDEYKTTKLVLRKIDPGTFMMGSPEGELGRGDNETRHEVTLTKPFYIGVFEVTQKQYALVTGENPSTKKTRGDCRPVDSVSFDTIRGTSSGTNWPASSLVDAGSFMGKIRARTELSFDLPTEAQWEYACRAGTTNALNNGKNLSKTDSCAEMDEVGRYKGNKKDGKGGYSDTHTAVGSYLPNAWGLYDMHGNELEACLDWYGADPGTDAVSDPLGPATGTSRVKKGGRPDAEAKNCRSAFRCGCSPSDPKKESGNIHGFRLVCRIPER